MNDPLNIKKSLPRPPFKGRLHRQKLFFFPLELRLVGTLRSLIKRKAAWLFMPIASLVLILFISPKNCLAAKIQDQLPSPFQKSYLLLEATENFPVSQGLKYFSPYRRTLTVSYQHVLGAEWIVGVSANFKSFRRTDLDREFALLSFSNQTQYVIRLHHPAYLLIGTKLMYLQTAQYARLPLVREPDFETEIGAGLTASFAYILARDWVASFRVDRWRGINTNRLHGFEVAFGLARSLDF